MACCGNDNTSGTACCTNQIPQGDKNCCSLDTFEAARHNTEMAHLRKGPGQHVVRVPIHSKQHPMIPRLYVMGWRNDMENRKHIINNAELGGVPHFEHDDNLYWEKKEQLSYNVEDRASVEAKVCVPHRGVLLKPPKHHPTSKYQSSLMYYKPC